MKPTAKLAFASVAIFAVVSVVFVVTMRSCTNAMIHYFGNGPVNTSLVERTKPAWEEIHAASR